MTAFCHKHRWCEEHDVDGVETAPNRIHLGSTTVLPVPPHQPLVVDDGPAWLLKVQIWASDPTLSTPLAYLDHEDEDELSMDADQLGEFIGQLDTFREALVAMRAQLDAKQVTV